MLLLFCILSFLVILEASTSLSRLSGYLQNSPESGLILQSSLALLSRMSMFLFMPALGYLADKNELYSEGFIIPIYYLIMVLGLIVLLTYNRFVISLYTSLIERVNNTGTFFRGGKIKLSNDYNVKPLSRKVKSLSGFYFLVLIAYVPYYLSWPLVIFLLDNFNENRAMLLGMSSVFNGLNTIVLTVFVDPKLIRLSKHNRLVNHIYIMLIKLRVYSSVIAFGMLLLAAWVINF